MSNFFKKCFITNADCMSTQSIIGVLNKNFANALWVPKDHHLDPDLPAYFQNVIKTYMGSDSRKQFRCVEVRIYIPYLKIGFSLMFDNV